MVHGASSPTGDDVPAGAKRFNPSARPKDADFGPATRSVPYCMNGSHSNDVALCVREEPLPHPGFMGHSAYRSAGFILPESNGHFGPSRRPTPA
jgi:hypothetical protein